MSKAVLFTFLMTIGLSAGRLLPEDPFAWVSRRFLQETGQVGAINVGQLCAGFMSDGKLDCNCTRDGALDVYAKCRQTQQTCTLDKYLCQELSFETVRSPTSPNTQASIYTTTIMKWIYNETCPFETKIQIQPDVPGEFGGPFVCGAELAGQRCRSCNQCSGTPQPTVTVDCENVEKGAKMTCGNVTQDDLGTTILSFDVETYPPVGGTNVGCGGGAAAVFRVGTLLTILSYSVYMLLDW